MGPPRDPGSKFLGVSECPFLGCGKWYLFKLGISYALVNINKLDKGLFEILKMIAMCVYKQLHHPE